MFSVSRKAIYDYLYNLFYGVVTENVYEKEPQELTKSDVEDGFIILTVGILNDSSEFSCETYGEARCFVEAYIPPRSRGRLNLDKYEAFENSINQVIKTAAADSSGDYQIQEESVISSDGDVVSNANNIFHTFIKSFTVFTDVQE